MQTVSIKSDSAIELERSMFVCNTECIFT